MIQSTDAFSNSQMWEVMTTAIDDSSEKTKNEYEEAEIAFCEFQEKSAQLITQLREQVNQLNIQIVSEKAYAATITNSFQAKVMALNGQISTVTELLNQVKQTNQQLNAQIAAVSAHNNALQARITHLTSPAGQNEVNDMQMLIAGGCGLWG